MGWALRSLVVLVVALASAPAAIGAEIPVTTNADQIADDGLCGLREAIFAARLDIPFMGCPAGSPQGTDTLQLSPATYVLALAGTLEDANATGDLDLSPGHPTRIVGRGAAVTIIDAKGIDRAFDVLATASLTLEDLAVRGGGATAGDPQSGGTINPEAGGDGGPSTTWGT